jgi:hypothetical protein
MVVVDDYCYGVQCCAMTSHSSEINHRCSVICLPHGGQDAHKNASRITSNLAALHCWTANQQKHAQQTVANVPFGLKGSVPGAQQRHPCKPHMGGESSANTATYCIALTDSIAGSDSFGSDLKPAAGAQPHAKPTSSSSKNCL